MLGSAKLTIAAAIVLLCGNAAFAQSLNMSNVCLLVTDGTLVGSPSDCSTYYSCSGSVATMKMCGSGMSFEKDAQQCVPSSQSTCAGGSNPCQNSQIGTWQAVSGSCSAYWYCSGSGPLQGYCPEGDYFNPYKQSCVYQSEYPCTTTDNIDGTTSQSVNLCAMIPNNEYYGNPMDCSKWNYCTDNVDHSGSCPTGYLYNVNQRMCSYASATTCSQVSNDTALTGSSTLGTSCTTVGSIVKATACNQYYQCSNNNVYQLYTCGSGYYFDTKTSACQPRSLAVNDCDRCLGSTNQFVNAYSTSSCQGYLVCNNGVEVGQGNCPSGYYFNEQLGGCSNALEPQYPFCNPNHESGLATSTTASSSNSSTTASTGSTTTSTTTTTTAATTTTTKA